MPDFTTCFGLTLASPNTFIYINIEKIIYNTIKFKSKIGISFFCKHV